MKSAKYQTDGDPRTSGPGFGVRFHEDALTEPLRWRKSRRVFVNSMSYLFHPRVPVEYIAAVWAVMAATPQHTYQILTKRHGRMRSLLNSPRWAVLVLDAVRALPDIVDGPLPLPHYVAARAWAESPELAGELPPPLPNVWLGVSVEDQKRADLRIPALLSTPAAVRFLSCEPLLGPVDLSSWLSCPHDSSTGDEGPAVLLDRPVSRWRCDWCATVHSDTHTSTTPGLGWLICGGESGAGARRMELGWARTLVDQCRAASVPVFVKQLGSAHGPHKGGDMATWPAEMRVREWPAVTG